MSNDWWTTEVDLASAFWRLELGNASSDLTTHGTLYGLKVSSGIFQKRILLALNDLIVANCVMSDILIIGNSIQENDKRLDSFLQRCLDGTEQAKQAALP